MMNPDILAAWTLNLLACMLMPVVVAIVARVARQAAGELYVP